MTTETSDRSIVTIVSGPSMKCADGVYRPRYAAEIVRIGESYSAAVNCLCGRKIRRDFQALDMARAYMDAGIDLARKCDPFGVDAH